MAKRSESMPKMREGLVIQTIGNEAIVYDPKTHQAHWLNRSAALVLRQVDGNTGIDDIASKVASDLGTSDGRLVRVALDRLGAAGLLKAPASAGRRAVLRGMTIALVPVVTSVLIPKAAAAASCTPLGGPCATIGECCPSATTCSVFCT